MKENVKTKDIEHPGFLLERHYVLRVFSENGRIAGNIIGAYDVNDSETFVIRDIRIDPEYLTASLLYSALCELIESIPAQVYKYRYVVTEGKDAYYSAASLLMFSYDDVEVKKEIDGNCYEVQFKDISKETLSLIHRYSDNLDVQLLTYEHGDKYREQILDMEKIDHKAHLMSPFNIHDFFPEKSYLIFDGDNLLGWILLRELSETDIYIAGFYVRKDMEKKFVGVQVAANIILKLIDEYEVLSFYIEDHNERHTNAYRMIFGNSMKLLRPTYATKIIKSKYSKTDFK